MSSAIGYAHSGDVNIAYHVMGNGPLDLVLVHGSFSHLEIDLELPAFAHFHDRLASFARVIRFDKRGTGLSDRGVGLPDFETRMDASGRSWMRWEASRPRFSGTPRADRCRCCSRPAIQSA